MPSHGSLTKAGKVRKQTPKIPAKPKKNPSPRVRNRKEFRRLMQRMSEATAATPLA
jgi:small subunit ribosomal protein S30e